jgi:NADPH:quinone reductase-like Zn-dependent oxidoreductase
VRAIVYSEFGGPEVLRLVEREPPRSGRDEVLVRLAVSGVNPTDWKARQGGGGRAMPFPVVVPNQDGAGVIEAVGHGVDPARIGERVWVWEAAWQRPEGTAQELVVLPSRQAVRLPDDQSFDVGASLGIPALTAHRCLTVGSLMGRNIRYQFVLVYTVPSDAKDAAVEDVTAAVAAGALPVGAEAGLPLHRFPLAETAAAHAAVQAGAVGKVLIDVGD